MYEGVYLDSLSLREAIISDGIVLEEGDADELVLHELAGCRAHELGRFENAARAWEAIDAIDTALALALRLA